MVFQTDRVAAAASTAVAAAAAVEEVGDTDVIDKAKNALATYIAQYYVIIIIQLLSTCSSFPLLLLQRPSVYAASVPSYIQMWKTRVTQYIINIHFTVSRFTSTVLAMIITYKNIFIYTLRVYTHALVIIYIIMLVYANCVCVSILVRTSWTTLCGRKREPPHLAPSSFEKARRFQIAVILTTREQIIN